jgi:major membrane immunogen (membrane-anchored lipoprotein)
MKVLTIAATVLMMALAVMSAGCTQADLVKDMAGFDRAYIPALSLTSAGNVAMSQKAMRVLTETWGTFKTKYADYSFDDHWKADFAYVDGQIVQAASIVSRGQGIVEAHEALEGVRERLLETRHRLGIDYYVDYLTVFHGPMEDIFLPAKDKTPATLTEADVTKIRTALPAAKAAWARVEAARLDNSVFTLSDQKQVEWREARRAETDALNAVEAALRAGDKAALIKAAAALRGTFAKLFTLFGDFDRLK